jgi:addiction module RelE/StbE family toxin
MKVKFTREALKEWDKLPLQIRKRASKKLPFLEMNPFIGKKLKGELSDFYSLRVWPYRVLYTVEQQTVLIHAVEHRQSVYKV